MENASEVGRRRITVLGVPVDDVIEDEAVALIVDWIEQGGAHQVATVNPEFVIAAQRDPVFAAVLAQTSLNTPDGFGLLLAARYLGTPLRGRVTGVELTLRLMALAAERGYRVFLLGAGPGVGERAAAVLQARFAGLKVVGCFSGSPQLRHEPAIRQIVTAARPDILLVAYGHPAQDLWIARNQAFLQVPLAMGVGGVFDYLAGEVRRAPPWLRRLGLEWAYRLLMQPKRWRRIIDAVPVFMLALLWQRHGARRG